MNWSITILTVLILMNSWFLRKYLKGQFNEFLIGVKGQLIGDSKIVHSQLSVLTVETSILKHNLELVGQALIVLSANFNQVKPAQVKMEEPKKRGPKPGNRAKKKAASEKAKAIWDSYTPSQREARISKMLGRRGIKRAALDEQPEREVNPEASVFAKALVGNG